MGKFARVGEGGMDVALGWRRDGKGELGDEETKAIKESDCRCYPTTARGGSMKVCKR